MYAPGLSDLGQIAAVVEAVGVPVNVLALPAGPSIAELAWSEIAAQVPTDFFEDLKEVVPPGAPGKSSGEQPAERR